MQTYYWLPYIFTSLINALLAVYIFKHRISRGAVSLFIIAFSNSAWAFLESLIWMGFSVDVRLKICYTQYFFIVLVPTFFVIFVLEYLGISRSFRKSHYPYLSIIPVLTIIAVWTNPSHNLFYSDYEFVSFQNRQELFLSHGPFFMLWAAYAYCLMIVATVIILRAHKSTSILYKKQYRFILLGVLIPWISNALYIFKMLPQENLDITPLSYTFTAVCFMWAFYSRRLFDLQPIARSEAFIGMSDGVLILDNKNRIADFNPAAQNIMSFLTVDSIGKKLNDICDADLADQILINRNAVPLHLKTDDRSNYYDLRISNLSDKKNRSVGRIFSFRNITEQKQMEAQLEYYATTDSLTGIFNRRHFNHMAEMELHRCIRYEAPLSLCMMDIDHFKTVNDDFGHDAGDRVMKEIVRICQQNLREMDLFSRWGGEEFVLLFPETDLDSAAEAAERVRHSIEQCRVRTTNGEISVTVSIGITELDTNASALEEGLRNADIAMYHAKNSGRNKCSIMNKQGDIANVSRTETALKADNSEI